MYFDRTSYVISIVQAVSYITKDWLNMIGHWQRSLPNFRGLYSIKMNQYIFLHKHKIELNMICHWHEFVPNFRGLYSIKI